MISRSHVIYAVLIKYIPQLVNTILDTIWLKCFIKFAFYTSSTVILLNIQNLYEWERVCSKVRFLFSNGKKKYIFLSFNMQRNWSHKEESVCLTSPNKQQLNPWQKGAVKTCFGHYQMEFLSSRKYGKGLCWHCLLHGLHLYC